VFILILLGGKDMKTVINSALLLVSIVLISGCTSGYSQYYTDLTQNQINFDQSGFRFLRTGEEPQIQAGNNPEEDDIAMMTEGYVSIGFSSFNGKVESIENAKTQAKKVGATKVLVYSKYTNTVSGAIPVTTYSPGQYITTNNYGNFSANTYGSGGYSSNTYGNYSGTSSTYIPGSSTTNYVPYNVQRYDQLATYWITKTRWMLGVRDSETPDYIKKELGTNKGIMLRVVIKDTPAYDADLFAGDVVTKLNDDVITNMQHWGKAINTHSGQTVALTIYRDGEYLEKSVALGR
jgi:serine protease Do